jgi:hypothetical protein
MAGDSLVAKSFRDKYIGAEVKLMIGNREDLQESGAHYSKYLLRGPEKCIRETLLPMVNFRRSKAFDIRAIKEFNSLLTLLSTAL